MRTREETFYKGEVVYNYAYDIAYEMGREPIRQLLGQPLAEFSIHSTKRNPRHLFFFRPQMARLPPSERFGPNGPVRVEIVVKLLPVGVVSISAKVPFAVASINDLVPFHDLQFSNGSLNEEVRRLAESIRAELGPHLIRPVPMLMDEEAYTVFCIEAPVRDKNDEPVTAEDWLSQHRREVAALLTQEPDVEKLSEQEATESTTRYLSYYGTDLVVVDWDAALIIDEPQDFHETLYVMELANLQLAELEAYDRILDDALERSYRDLRARPTKRRVNMLADLREIRIDLARFSDELSNITKFFGDWHLARIYDNVSARFHLGDWHRTVNEKLKTLDGLYQLLKQDQINRWMLILETIIVILFVLDLVILAMGLRK